MNRLYIVVLFVLVSVSTNAQKQGLGCVYKPEIDGKVPLRPRLMTRDYTVLPKAYSLKKYCPIPQSQGPHGTCTSWATTYAARTICEAVKYEWTNEDSITTEAFAPIFIYKQVSNSPNCEDGSSVAESLKLLKEKGAPKFRSFNVWCADFIPELLFSEATNYKIDDYTSLFDDYYPNRHENKVQTTKKALTQNHPVVIAMDCYKSFGVYGNDLWEGQKDVFRGPHALCVVGYDDEKYGGAFEIMNSWGDYWGNGGFIWVRYDDYCSNVKYAYDVYSKKSPIPNPIPTPIQKKYSMSGDMLIIERDGGGCPLVVNNDVSNISYYYMTEDYPSGKKFRLTISNHEPAWVYVIASDMQNNVTKLFPYADNISAYLNYSENNIAIPDESHEFELDATPGTDYFCVLYSQEELDINIVVEEIKEANGSFYDKLNTVLGDKLAPKDDVRYVMNDIGFSAKSDSPVVPLVVEISHQDIKVDYQR